MKVTVSAAQYITQIVTFRTDNVSQVGPLIYNFNATITDAKRREKDFGPAR